MVRHYFDWAATALQEEPPNLLFLPKVPFGNPSSPHGEGREARAFLEKARSRSAAVLGVRPEELFWTSGGSESNAIVLFSLLTRPEAKDGGLLYLAGEHPSIRENAAMLERFGLPCGMIALERDGRVRGKGLEAALKKNPRAKMAAIMAVNNETGAVNDMKNLAETAAAYGKALHLHCDAVQAAGKVALDGILPFVDSAAISAHKLGGPRGIGLLYLKKNIVPLVRGGGQEGGLRPGTENTAGASALAEALEGRASPEILEPARAEAAGRMAALLDRLRKIPRFSPIPADRADEDPRFSPWILQAAFKGIPGEVMVRALDGEGFAVSTGSACSSPDKKRPVLEAMGLDAETAFSGIRISQGWSTTMKDIEALAGALEKLCLKL